MVVSVFFSVFYPCSCVRRAVQNAPMHEVICMLNQIKKIRQISRKIARKIKKINEYLAKLFREVLEEERNNIKKCIASFFNKSAKIISVGATAIILIGMISLIVFIANTCNVSIGTLKEVWLALFAN